MFPIVAVALNMAFEGFVWQENTVFGLVLLGNIIVLTPANNIKTFLKRFAILPEIFRQDAG